MVTKSRLLISILFLLCLARSTSAGWALVDHNAAGATSSGSGATTPALNTTGANLIVINISGYGYACNTSSVTLTSSPSAGTFTPIQGYPGTGGVNSTCLWYLWAPSTSSSQTFSVANGGSCTGAGCGYFAIMVAAFSGGLGSGSYDVQNGANGSSGTLATGSVTASVNNELYIAAAGFDVGNVSGIDSSFTITDTRFYVSGESDGGSMAYYVQSTAGAINPTWTFSGTSTNSAAIATFEPAAGGVTCTITSMLTGTGGC